MGRKYFRHIKIKSPKSLEKKYIAVWISRKKFGGGKYNSLTPPNGVNMATRFEKALILSKKFSWASVKNTALSHSQ